MRYVYTFLFYLITPFIILRLYWKGRKLKSYRTRIKERFFLGSVRHTKPVDVFIHAVSLGEVVAATPLIVAMLEKNWRVLVTTMTPSGSDQVCKRFGATVEHQYLPYDLPTVLNRFFKQIKPRIGIIMETELWPNLIYCAKKNKIPLVLLNGRISNRAYPKYQHARFMFKSILNQLTQILVQSKEDQHRFISLGAPSNKVCIGGNIKYDVQPIVAQEPLRQLFMNACGSRIILTLASTHHDEEKQILAHMPVLKQVIPNLLILIAPRHPERFQIVYQLCHGLGYKTALRSSPETIMPETDVVIIDSLGELNLFYSLSHYAFVGGSFVPVGGHNVLEPIALQIPVFCGPFMNNSKAICDELVKAAALCQVVNAQEMIEKVIVMQQDKKQRERQIKNATAVLQANQGVLIKFMECIESYLI